MNIYVHRKTDSGKVSPREVFNHLNRKFPEICGPHPLKVLVTMGQVVRGMAHNEPFVPGDNDEKSVLKFISSNYFVTTEDEA